MSRDQLLQDEGYIQIPFILTVTNHLEVEAEINNIQGRFLIDTGASNTCIGSDRVERFLLTSKDSEIKAAGAGATDMATAVSTGNEIRIGNWHTQEQQIVVFDLSHVNVALEAHEAETVDGIIGSDILDTADAVIDYKHRKLYLLGSGPKK